MYILIIDDEEIRINPIREYLEMSDHNVVVIGSIKKAFDFFIENSELIDIIILDVMMRLNDDDKELRNGQSKIDDKRTDLGFSTGVVFWRFLNEVMRVKNMQIPIIFFSARVDLESQFPELRQAKDKGLVEILRKPMRLDEFEKKILEIHQVFKNSK